MSQKPYGYTGKLPGAATNQNADFLLKNFAMESQTGIRQPTKKDDTAHEKEPLRQKESVGKRAVQNAPIDAQLSDIASDILPAFQEIVVSRKSLKEMARRTEETAPSVVDKKI